MAFSRDELKEIGISDEHVDSVMSLYGKNVQSLKDEIESHKQEKNQFKQEVKSYKERVNEQNEQLDELKVKASKGENLEEQINALQQANKDKDAEHEKEMNEVKLRYEIDNELNRAGAKNTLAVMALINRDNITYDSEKGLCGLSEQLEDIKQSDSYLFKSDNSDDDNSNSANGSNNGSSDFGYNAGNGKGNKGGEADANALGEEYYERLFGKNKQ